MKRTQEPRLAPAKADTRFELVSDFEPKGDQPRAIGELVEGLERGDKHQVLLGVTGSGKTFTIASVIAKTNRPTLVLAHNKTLAAQLYQEFKAFFPRNAVEYFVSYYDYYQPEAYVPRHDLYIEKETAFVGRLNPVGIVLASLLMSLLYLGGEQAQIELRLPSAITGLFQGMLLFFLLGADVLINYRLRVVRPATAAKRAAAGT